MVPVPHTSQNPAAHLVTLVYDTPSACWQQSDRADWLLALLQQASVLGISQVIHSESFRRFACWCARSVVHLHQAQAGRTALQTAERSLDEPTTLTKLDQAWAESYVRCGVAIRGGNHLHDWVRTAAAVGACIESANPDPLTAAHRASSYAVLAQVWDRVRTSEVPQLRGPAPLYGCHPWTRVRAAYQAGVPLGFWEVCQAVDVVSVQWSELVTAARYQVSRKLLAAQATQLRTWVSDPFGGVTWAQLLLDGVVGCNGQGGTAHTVSDLDASIGQGPWTWGRTWNVGTTWRILYGLVNEALVFIPVTTAERQVGIYTALAGARTWGEFQRALPEGVYEELIQSLIEGGHGFDTFYTSWLDSHPWGTRQEAGCAYDALPYAERLPNTDDPFDSADIPGFCDGDWPAWPQQDMLKWVPTEIQARYGQRASSNFNGDCLLLSADQEVELVQAFRAAGYQCQRADRFVRRACGYAADVLADVGPEGLVSVDSTEEGRS